MMPKPAWEVDYDWYALGELACIHAKLRGGDKELLSRIEHYLHEEKVSSIPWPPQTLPMPRFRFKGAGVDADTVSRF